MNVYLVDGKAFDTLVVAMIIDGIVRSDTSKLLY
jgi:hypothetical protein